MPPKTHDIGGLDDRIQTLGKLLKDLGRVEDLEELRLRVIPRPGWTTPAEFFLVSGLVDSLTAQVKSVATLRKTLVTGAGKVRPQG